MLPADATLEASSNLLCYLEGESWPEIVDRLASERERLVTSRTWLLAPPEFVSETADGDHTVGVVLRLAPPAVSGESNDLEAERAMLADVEAVVAWAARVSADEDLEFGFELDGEPVGWVEGGHADRQLNEGLIQPWRARL